jgi:hypothetical protein
VTDETAHDHYGKRRTAWQQHHIRDIPVPLANEVATVRKQLEMFEDRRLSRLARLATIDQRKEAKRLREAAAALAAGPTAPGPDAIKPVLEGPAGAEAPKPAASPDKPTG